MSDETDRVKIWNTFFKLAWEEAKSVYETSTGRKSSKTFDPLGGTLPDKEFHTLASLVLLNLAIEARANHLIDELEEEDKISKDVAEAARWLSTKQKWFLLPALAKISTTLDSSKMPHQAISKICRQRNRLLHVKYTELKRGPLSPKETLNLFKNFVKAMENMNVVLERIDKERDEVLEIGNFEKT
jgi:hypothetical protein